MAETARKRAEGGAGRLAEFAAGIECAGLPAEVVWRAKQLVSDALACGVADSSVRRGCGPDTDNSGEREGRGWRRVRDIVV